MSMKQKISYSIVVGLLFLLSVSLQLQASVGLVGLVKGSKVALVEAAQQSVDDLVKNAAKQLPENAAAVFKQQLSDFAQSAIMKLGANASEVSMNKAVQQAMDTAIANIKIIVNLSQDFTDNFFNSFKRFGSVDFSKLSPQELQSLNLTPAKISQLKSTATNSADNLQGFTAFVRKTTDAPPLASTKNFTQRLGSTINDTVSQIKRNIPSAFKKTKLSDTDEGLLKMYAAEAKNSARSMSDRSLAAQNYSALIFKEQTSLFGRGVRSFGTKLGWGTLAIGASMWTAMLFMVPSLYQSSFLANQQRNALLQTYIPPVKFGKVVLQMPDSVINAQNPAASQFIYYGIPVENPGDKLSAQAAAVYPGISGPTSNNKISHEVSVIGAKIFSLGNAKDIKIKRYNLDAQALSKLPIFVSYSDPMQSWADWGTNGIPDAAFSQMMINLNTGYIFYADGTQQGASAAQLVGQAASGKSVQSFLKTKYGQLKNAGNQYSYTEFQDGFDTSKVNNVASPLADQFNCSCLSAKSGVLSADVVDACLAGKNPTCLLSNALNQIAAGLVINADGMPLQPGQDVAAEVAKGALGQVIPIHGYGDQFDAVLSMFPGARQNAIANSGVLTVNLGTDVSNAAPSKIQGAEPDNYAAKGVYIYQCKNTPLAKMLRSQAGGSASYNSVITDYIVFLDSNLNQVPLMSPQPDPAHYNFMSMQLNPAIQYFSTIMGSMDSNGGFTFLPQCNIVSPAALIAKGLPASFPPLYSLKAVKGSFGVNYNKNLSSVIGTIVQSLQNNPKLGQQVQAMQAAMLKILAAGPFGKYQLRPLDDDLQPTIAGIKLAMYTGYNAYPVSQDVKKINCSDLLIPVSAEGKAEAKTVTLPSNNVTQYYGIVSDLTYTVAADGSISVGADGFENSPLTQTVDGNNVSWSIDATKATQFFWLDKLTAMGQSDNPQFALSQDLLTLVQQARQAWITWIQSTHGSQLSNQEFAGITIPGTSNILTIAGQQSLATGLYIYTCSPNPSNMLQDYFVLSNSSTPSATDAKLGTMSASSASATTYMISIVSGLVYNSVGKVVPNAQVDATQLLQAMYTRNPQGFSDELKVTLNIAVAQVSASADAMVYPFTFGGLQLGMYQADIDARTYLYFDAGGAGASASFTPSDYFVTIDSYSRPLTVGNQISSDTQFVVSLVSGQVYGQQGAVAMMDANLVAQLLNGFAPNLRDGMSNEIATLAAQYKDQQQNQQQISAQMNAALPNLNGAVTFPQASVVASINALNAQEFLPMPYSMIKQDPTTGMYVIVAPANQDGSEFIYTFINVPNTFVNPTNNTAMMAAAMYDGKGNLLNTMTGQQLTMLLQQYGIVIGSNNKQSLGVPNSSGMLPLDPADKALRPGVSGKSMIYSNDPTFPSRGIVSPISYQNSQFHIYYNTLTRTYYAMQVSGSTMRYIDMNAGTIYSLDGSAMKVTNAVAMNSNGDAIDMLLPYNDADNFIRTVMKIPGSNVYQDFLNLPDSFQAFVPDPTTSQPSGMNELFSVDGSTSLTIAQMPFPDTLTSMPDVSYTTGYNVYMDNASPAISYAVNPSYQWQPLEFLPIDMNSRQVVTNIPDIAVYGKAGLVMNNGTSSALVFANTAYTFAGEAGKNSYTFSSPTAGTITLAQQVDAITNAPYVTILANGTIYTYQYSFAFVAVSQLQDYQANAWKAQIIADVTGNVILEENLPVDASGNPQLSPVTMSAVINPPTDQASLGNVQSALSNILQDTANGRYLVALPEGAYSYMPQASFVNIENGAFFDANGNVQGITIQVSDLIDVLQQLSFGVVRNNNGQAALQYRGVATVVEPSSSSVASAGVPAQKSRSTLLGRFGSKAKKVKSKKRK